MILVVGATGQLGGAITRRLLEQGQEVRILVRPDSPSEQLAAQGMATSAQELIAAGAKPGTGDLKDCPSLDRATAGVDVVITTANSALRGGADNVETVDQTGNCSLIDAAAAAGVKQFIFVSVLGADPNSPVPFVRAKATAEQRLRSSGMTYTILEPNFFMDVWVPMIVGGPVLAGQPVTLIGEGRRRHSMVAARDVAAFATAAVGNPAAADRTIPIGGPEALSWRDVIAAFERALGRSIPVRIAAPGEPVPGVWPSVLPLLMGLEMYDSPMEMGEIARTFGVTLTPLDQFVQDMLARPAA
jgi:NADH dehydrogenase